jgi:hypothetical protein
MERKDVRALLPAPEQRDDDLPPSDDDEAEPEVETAEPADEHEQHRLIAIKHLATKMVEQLDRNTAHALYKILSEDILWQHKFMCALASELGLEIGGGDDRPPKNKPSAGNGTDPDASAAIRKAHFAESEDRWIEGDTL